MNLKISEEFQNNTVARTATHDPAPLDQRQLDTPFALPHRFCYRTSAVASRKCYRNGAVANCYLSASRQLALRHRWAKARRTEER
jgi:hypothetical protein